MAKLPPELASLVQRLSPAQQRLFACDCATHVLPFFERFWPDDDRPRTAIAVARRYARGAASSAELEHASDAVEACAWAVSDAACINAIPLDEAASPAAIAAAGCGTSDALAAVEAVIAVAIEAVVTAAVGVEEADRIWAKANDVTSEVRARYAAAEAQERAWQLQRAYEYVSDS